MAGNGELQPRKQPNRQWVILMLGAGWIVWGFGYQTVWHRFNIQLEGTVTSSQDVPATGAPRYATYYVIHGSDGQDRTYVAGPTDGSLGRSIPVGARIRKEWGQLGYEVNGRWIAFPVAFYSATLGLAAFLAVAAISAWRRQR
jgi:hypothetical protein